MSFNPFPWILCALLLNNLPAGAQGPVAHALFTANTHVDPAAFRSDVLAGAEVRMRLVQLSPNEADETIDLSQPLELELFPDVHYKVQLRPDRRSAMAGLEVWKGRVPDPRFDHLPHYINTVFVLNRATGKLVANIETEKGFFQVLPTAVSGIYRVRDCKIFGNELCRVVEQENLGPAGASRSNCGGDCNETDADGRYVVDVFAGYSPEAALLAGDMAAHAQANLETVNTGLANSQVDTVYLRLVGTAVGGENPGIVTSVLDDAWGWFAAEIQELAPDLIALFQTPTNDPGSAGGWGSMPGRATVNGVEWPTVFRHEAGHNSGGNHCFPDNDNYRNGYDNSHWRTHMCGNDVNFYSSPLLTDDQGSPIGDADQADMVRNWNEMAHTMANHNMHRVPYSDQDTCAGRICMPQHWGDPIEYITRVQFNTLDNQQADPSWNCPSTPGYSDYTELSTDVVPGEVHLLLVQSTYSWEESTLRAWIDWDGDGLLDAGDLVMDMDGIGPWSTPVQVPSDAEPGAVRLRVRLQYGLDEPHDACLSSAYSSGESEDYTVNILDLATIAGGPGSADAGMLVPYPNPTRGNTTLRVPRSIAGPAEILIRDPAGRCVRTIPVPVRPGSVQLDLSDLSPGPYLCELHHAGGVLTAKIWKQ